MLCLCALWYSGRAVEEQKCNILLPSSKIRSFGTKCLFMISAGCLFPTSSIHRLFVSWKKNCSLSPLLRAEQRTAVLKACHRGNFPLSCILPQHIPQAHISTCGSSAWSQGFVACCAVFFSWLLSHPDGRNGPRNTAGHEREKMKPQRTSLLLFTFVQQDYAALLCLSA